MKNVYLSPFGLLLQNIDWVVYKQQRCVSHFFGGWEARDGEAGRRPAW